jgi:hypothetical protein
VRFTWRKYAAIDTERETALWEAQHPYAELLEWRGFDPVNFSREFMNEPTDDASSMFPFDLTERMVDPSARFMTRYPRPDLNDELIVFGYDLAASAEVRADYCCLIVVAVHKQTRRRRVLWAYREKGLGYDEQIELLRAVCRRYHVAVGVVEANGFQRWIRDACARFPETASKVFGHTTGRDKGSLEDGVPALKLGIKGGLWDGALPAGDDESSAFTSTLRTEAAAFGWKDGKLQGVGEHDDTVMALWLTNIGVRMVEDILLQEPEEEIVTMEDLGIERVKIGDW